MQACCSFETVLLMLGILAAYVKFWSQMGYISSINQNFILQLASLIVGLNYSKTDGSMQQTHMYIADPVTTTWLRSSVDGMFGYPALVRFSWQTTTRLLEDTACAVHW